MSFTRSSYIDKLDYNEEEWSLIKNLRHTGALFDSNQSPEFTPVYEGGKDKNLPISFFSLEWAYRIFNTEGKEILKYTATDRHQFNPLKYNYEDIREMVALSFDHLNNNFEGQQIEGFYPDSLLQPSRDEFENWCQSISQFLKGRVE
jgi:hypothetical protein